MLWRGGASLEDTPLAPLTDGMDVLRLREGDGIVRAAEELGKTLVEACREGVSVVCFVDGAGKEVGEAVATTVLSSRRQMRESSWYRQMVTEAEDGQAVGEERRVREARGRQEDVMGALQAAREAVRGLVVATVSLEDWDKGEAQRARLEEEVARLEQEEGDARRALGDAVREASGSDAAEGIRPQTRGPPWVGLVYSRTASPGKAAKKEGGGKAKAGGDGGVEVEEVVSLTRLEGEGLDAALKHWGERSGAGSPGEQALEAMRGKKDSRLPLYCVLAAREVAVSSCGWLAVEGLPGTVGGLWAGGGGNKAAAKKGKKNKKGKVMMWAFAILSFSFSPFLSPCLDLDSPLSSQSRSPLSSKRAPRGQALNPKP